MDTTFAVDALKVAHVTDYRRDGSTVKQTVYRFYLGDHGPFVEKFNDDAPQPASINARIEQLRTELRGIVS